MHYGCSQLFNPRLVIIFCGSGWGNHTLKSHSTSLHTSVWLGSGKFTIQGKPLDVPAHFPGGNEILLVASCYRNLKCSGGSCGLWKLSTVLTYNVCSLCGILGPKLLDLDLINGVTTEEGDSKLSLKVDLQHFGEVCNVLCLYQRRKNVICCLLAKRIHSLAPLCMATSLKLD